MPLSANLGRKLREALDRKADQRASESNAGAAEPELEAPIRCLTCSSASAIAQGE